MHLEVSFVGGVLIEKKEREALYLGGHKVGYRVMKGTERGVLYKKNNEEVFQSCTSFIQDMLTEPCIIVKPEKEYAEQT